MFERRMEFVETPDAVIGLTGLPRILAIACAAFFPLDQLNARGLPVATMGIRGQTGRGSRVLRDEASAYEFDHYMADMAGALKALGAKSCHLFGYSIGGYFTTAFAIANPERVASLILVEPGLFLDKQDLLRRAELFERGADMESLGDMLSFVAPRLGADDAKVVAGDIRKDWQSSDALAGVFRVRAENPISTDDLATLKMPVLLIGGTESDVNWIVEKAADAIPHSRVWWIDGASHLDLMSEEFADEIADVVEQFIGRM